MFLHEFEWNLRRDKLDEKNTKTFLHQLRKFIKNSDIKDLLDYKQILIINRKRHYDSDFAMTAVAKGNFKLAKFFAKIHGIRTNFTEIFYWKDCDYLVKIKKIIAKAIIKMNLEKMLKIRTKLGKKIFYRFSWHLKWVRGEKSFKFLFHNDLLRKFYLYELAKHIELLSPDLVKYVMSKYDLQRKNVELSTNVQLTEMNQKQISLSREIIKCGAQINTKEMIGIFDEKYEDLLIERDNMKFLLENGLDILQKYKGNSLTDMVYYHEDNGDDIFEAHLIKQRDIVMECLTNERLLIKDLAKIVCGYLS